MNYNSGKEIQVGDKVVIIDGLLEIGEEATVVKLAPTHSTNAGITYFGDPEDGVEVNTKNMDYLYVGTGWLKEL